MGRKIFYPLNPGIEVEINSDRVIIGDVELVNDKVNPEYVLDLDESGNIIICIEDKIAAIKGISINRNAIGRVM